MNLGGQANKKNESSFLPIWERSSIQSSVMFLESSLLDFGQES